MKYETRPRTFFVKDMIVECPHCGMKNQMREIITNGKFDEMSFADNSDAENFNPFNDPNDKRSWGTDRITIPFNCHCKNEECNRYFSINLVTAIFGYDIYDDECNVVATEYTERV